MQALLINHNFTPDWLKDSGLDYFIIDQSEDKKWLEDFPQEHIAYVENVGNCDYQKLLFIIDNYDHLPDIFLWGKTNLFKYIGKDEWDLVKNNTNFTPLLTKDHKTYRDKFGVVCFYDDDGIYNERNDNWYTSQFTHRHGINSYADFAKYLNLKSPAYLPFAPGGNYLLTRERVHRYGKDFYQAMADMLPHDRLPLEAQFCERTYYTLWK
jgi:hypothetical protein